MKKGKLQNESLEQLIGLLLPEGKIIEDKNFELTEISLVLLTIINSIGFHTTLEAIFNAFYNLHYPMSVIEPLQVKDSKPYIDTNSHAIYIAVNADKLTLLNEYFRFLHTEKQLVPESLIDIHKLLQQFIKK